MSTEDDSRIRLTLREFRYHSLGPIELELAAGETVAIGGPSGSGKSLLLRAIADLDPHLGVLELDGRGYLEFPGPDWRRRVGLLPPEPAWWAPRVRDHFETMDGVPLEALGFGAETADWTVERLSSGERQRLGLLRLLERRPAVLLLDEASANLDPEGTRRVESLVADYLRDEQACALWVSHDAEQRRRIGDRVLALEGGRISVQSPSPQRAPA